ncbi:hypothetical protein P2318_16610 [Myxococcaceae bacterium GXIMD 01537]
MASTSPAELDVVRKEVRDLLQRSPAFAQLSAEEKRGFANDMVRVGAYLADPGWVRSKARPPGAEGLANDPVEDLKKRLAADQEQANKQFDASAVKQGVEQFGEMVNKVDFPNFVSGLIQGVFQSIVDASIQQMKAYGELLAATAKSVDQFAQDHISDAQVRDHVRNRYPSLVRMEQAEDGSRRLALNEEAEDTSGLNAMVGGQGSVDLSSAEGEQAFITQAKLEMARSRQQSMALMVLLGINRIVVTNGRINAKVVFDMRASDMARRQAEAQLHDRAEQTAAAATGFALPWGGGGGFASTNHVATVSSSVDDTSESKAQVKAQLAGDVRVNFKSDYFPLERMLDAGAIQNLTSIAQPGRGAPAQPVAATPTVPATQPAVPRSNP